MPSRSMLKRPTTLPLKKVVDDQPPDNDDDVFSGTEVQDPEVYRVRTFSTSGKKGIINRGDSFKRRSTSSHYSLAGSDAGVTSVDIHNTRNSSVNSVESSLCSGDSAIEPTCYNVLLMGPNGVGKSSIIQQFKTSEYMGNEDIFQGECGFCMDLKFDMNCVI